MFTFSKHVMAVGGFLLIWLDTCRADTLTIPCEASQLASNSQYGMHIHKFHDPRFVPKGEFGSWRLWDSGVTWGQVQPARDGWNFRRLDLALDIGERLGLEVGITLGPTPEWASARPSEHSLMGLGAAAEPLNLSDWDIYVETLAKRYKGRLKFYEIWNEPSTSAFFTGSVETMVELARRAYKIIKAIDPSALVLTPSPAKMASIRWLTSYIEAGGGQYADILGFHFYTDQDHPDALIELISRVKDVVRPKFPNMPIWNTESGLRFAPIRDQSLNSQQGIPSSSAHLATWVILGSCMGLGRFFYYAWDDANVGLVDDRQGGSERITLAGWRAARRWLLGSKLSRCERAGNVWKCFLAKENGDFAFIGWGTIPMTVDDLGEHSVVSVEDLVGNTAFSSAHSITLTMSPTLVRYR